MKIAGACFGRVEWGYPCILVIRTDLDRLLYKSGQNSTFQESKVLLRLAWHLEHGLTPTWTIAEFYVARRRLRQSPRLLAPRTTCHFFSLIGQYESGLKQHGILD